jgi:hypothetical protein
VNHAAALAARAFFNSLLGGSVMSIEECEQCSQPYLLREVSSPMVTGEKYQFITCPHCWSKRREFSTGYFKTSKLTPDEHREYLAQKAGAR